MAGERNSGAKGKSVGSGRDLGARRLAKPA
eukprot:COSAG02_NODE_41892_length_390_cov_0.463918_1_plen_29_part_10